MNPPQKILLEFFLALCFKGRHAASCGIHTGHDMLDRAVLPLVSILRMISNARVLLA